MNWFRIIGYSKNATNWFISWGISGKARDPRIKTTRGESFVFLPKNIIGAWEARDEPLIPSKVFGFVINGKKEENYPFMGKIVVMADSGWTCDSESTFPGYGVVHLGDNQQLLLNIFKYL